jgi:hypothetical protein
MKKLIVTVLLTLGATAALADQYVDGYIRKDGTYVPGHFRSSPDAYKFNNFSTQGNANPYTGERGSVPAYPQYDPYQAPRQRRWK